MYSKKDQYRHNLFQGSKSINFERARELRQSKTEAEEKLWELLRNRQLKGKKFRRQHPMAGYILDFYCHECKLAVELDGYHHRSKEQKEYDAARTKILNEIDITVVRFWNAAVMDDVERVLGRIAVCLG